MTFQYDKLPNNGFVRIFELKPGKDGDPLQGNLRTYLRKEAPTYEALSYVWGSSERNKHMQCNDQAFMITDSLDLALRRLGLISGLRCLWIGQICIGQPFLEERSEQFSIMRDIYSGATLVNAWLDPADAGESGMAGMVISAFAKKRSYLLRAEQHFPKNEYYKNSDFLLETRQLGWL
ncbi:Heterokaryon incompatibility protein 6, OR allele [Fusarium oxysporum f. sp. cubense race 1]|uniref:Heterokaryon incompatibility protein 6, OR allele n=1 Tax=Fusarium oxysporum f. sp. cubense (strain race 1) TaxID=1229664 RepID=N4UXD4_FUSC1|nr:Heterokaryon incompatibility protein 6, OR allele [Fusarium oxysporum f. sp. cubense race 1]